MASLVLEGATLGERHQHYNKLLKDAISSNIQPAEIDYDKSDVENLVNIDIASHNKDVAYILDVLKGDDMLYVSRAIKRSNWLINDDQFAHIIEPQYLHSELFPQMMAKASCKFLLHIRLNMKRETRIDQFFEYLKEKDLKTAFKWLPQCSLNVIENNIMALHISAISPDIFSRLCKRSSTAFEIFVRSHGGYQTQQLQAAMILLRSHTDIYLDGLCNYGRYYPPNFGKKHTEIVMKKCPHRFIDNFEKFMYSIDIDTFAKYLKKEDIEKFVLKQLENKDVKTFLDQEKISIFIKYMPTKGKYELIQQFINQSKEEQETKNDSAVGLQFGEIPDFFAGHFVSKASRYQWYVNAPFDVTFADFKKMIRKESNAGDRYNMLMILVINTRNNLSHIYSLLQYYQKNHINEPFRFKVQFVNTLIQKTDFNLYDDLMWNILDEIFRSMEVYVDSENNVETCIKSIIVRRITRDQPVPDIIQQKFKYDSMYSFQKKLNEEQKHKVFAYLYSLFIININKHGISNQAELVEYVALLEQGLNLLLDWKKELADFPLLINKIKDCARIKKEKGWNTSLAVLYDTKKSWKKILFQESVILFPSQIVCMNALKHDPDLLVSNKEDVEALRFNDAVSMKQVLRKLRVYWQQTTASEWMSSYRKRLDQPSGHKSVVRGLFLLQNRQQFTNFLKEYEPLETKVNWADVDELKFSLRKNIARNMHIARPQIKPDAVLSYARDDYVQYTQPALNALLYNIKLNDSRACVVHLLNGRTTLQKHGLHLAFSRLSSTEMNQIFLDAWRTNRNLSARAALFVHTHERLCREQDEQLVAELWSSMQIYMDSLTAEENKKIYNTFGRLAKVHPSVKPALCMKSYKFLKSLPPKADCKNIIHKVREEMSNIIEQLDSDFVANILLEFVDQVLLTRTYGYSHRHHIRLFISYLLIADDEDTQLQRYEKVFVPFIEKSLLVWNKIDDRCYYIRENLENILHDLYRSTLKFRKVKPTALYNTILTKLEKALPVTQHYIMFRQMKLAIALIEILDNDKFDPMDNIASDLNNVVVNYLKKDIDCYGVSVYRLFGKALSQILNSFWVSRSLQLYYLKTFLTDNNFVPIYLMVIKMMDAHYNDDDQKEDLQLIHDLLRSHPSPEVEVYYYNKFGDLSVIMKK